MTGATNAALFLTRVLPVKKAHTHTHTLVSDEHQLGWEVKIRARQRKTDVVRHAAFQRSGELPRWQQRDLKSLNGELIVVGTKNLRATPLTLCSINWAQLSCKLMASLAPRQQFVHFYIALGVITTQFPCNTSIASLIRRRFYLFDSFNSISFLLPHHLRQAMY